MSARPNPVGDHTPRDVLARSVFGTLWECVKGDGDEPSAAVRFLEGIEGDDRKRVSDAMQVAMGVDDGNCIPVLNVVDEDDALAIVSGPVDGTSMRDLLLTATIKRKLLPLDVLARVALDMLTGLAALHLHADSLGEAAGNGFGGVSPDGFVVCRDGATRFVEPGLGVALSRTKAYATHPKRLGYDAPEVLDGEDATARSDLFSVATMIWELLVGRRMLPGSNLEAMKRRLGAPIPRPAKRPKGEIVPDALASVVARALSRDPGQRFGDPIEMGEAIEAAMEKISDGAGVAAALDNLSPKRSIRPPQVTAPPRATKSSERPDDDDEQDAARPEKPKAAPPPRNMNKTIPQGTLRAPPPPKKKPAPPPPRKKKPAIEDELSVSDLESIDSASATGANADAIRDAEDLIAAARETFDEKAEENAGELDSDDDAPESGADINVDLDDEGEDDKPETSSDEDDAPPKAEEAPEVPASANFFAPSAAAKTTKAAETLSSNAENSKNAFTAGPIPDARPPKSVPPQKVVLKGKKPDPRRMARTQPPTGVTKQIALDSDRGKKLPSADEEPAQDKATDKKPPSSRGKKAKKKVSTRPPKPKAAVVSQIGAKATPVAEAVAISDAQPANRTMLMAVGGAVVLLVILFVAFGGSDETENSRTAPTVATVLAAPVPPPKVEPTPEPVAEPTPEPATDPTVDPEPEPAPEPAPVTDPQPSFPRPGGPFPTPPSGPKPTPKPKADYIPDDI